MNTLDLDTLKSINDHVHINTINKFQTIYKLIHLIKTYGFKKCVNMYDMNIKYLNKIMLISYEFDDTGRYIIIKYDSNTNKKMSNLILNFTDYDDPFISWIKKGKYVPTYESDDTGIVLGPGEYLINFVHRFLHFIGYKRVRLDDDSYLKIKKPDGTKIKAKLWLYLLIKQGRNWYSKFGYTSSNISTGEYNLLINDIRSINLTHVSKELSPENHLFELIKELPLNQTLYEYIQSHDIYTNMDLLNNLFQSVHKETYWGKLYDRIFVANICQTNDNMDNYVKLRQ
jgi:hypothetical protein